MIHEASRAELAGESLGTIETLAQSLSGLAPTLGMAFGTTIVAISAGGAVPLSYVIASIGCIFLTYVFVVFTRRMATSGVAYSYVSAVFGKRLGFDAGWVYVGGYTSAFAVTFAILGLNIQAFFNEFGVKVDWFLAGFISMALIVGACYIGVKPSLRAQVVAELVSVGFLIIIGFVVLAKGGAEGISFSPFNPSSAPNGWSGVIFGAVFAISGFVGFEGAASLGLESKNPKRTIPLALILTVIIGALVYVFISFTLAIGYGPHHADTWAKDAVALDTITAKFAGTTSAKVVDAMVIISGLSAWVAVTNLNIRVIYGMSVSRMAPKLLSRVNRFKTPDAALLLVTVLGLACVIGFWIAKSGAADGAELLIGLVAGTNIIGFILVYIAISLAAIWAFGRKSKTMTEYVIRIGVPLIAIFVFGTIIYNSVIPPPASPYNLEPYLMVAWIAIGVILSYVLRPTRTLEEAEQLGEALGHEQAPVGGAGS